MRYFHGADLKTGIYTTVWDIEVAVPHTVVRGIDLRDTNPKWPATFNSRNGGAYDLISDTFFMADYDGDALFIDDNLIEVARDGAIVNGWVTSGPNNNSSDGSLVDGLWDVAVISGTTSVVATALGDTNGRYYLLSLEREGLFFDDSWRTEAQCTLPGVGDLVGVEYDPASGYLFFSERESKVITVADTNCTIHSQFVCDGSDAPLNGYSGLTIIPTTEPRELWLLPYTPANTTVRCQMPALDLNLTLSVDGTCGSSNLLSVPGGTEVTFCYTVSNPAFSTYTQHTLTDTLFGTILTDILYTLAPGDSFSVTQTATITTNNIVTATWYATAPAIEASATGSAQIITDPTTPVRFCQNNPIVIPDADANNGFIEIDANVPIHDLNFPFTVTHPTIGDLDLIVVNLTSGAGATLIQRPGYTGTGRGCTGDNFQATFDDEGTISAQNQCSNSTPAYPKDATLIPKESLTIFDNTPLQGTWLLYAADNAIGDSGEVTEWCIEAYLAQTLPTSVSISTFASQNTLPPLITIVLAFTIPSVVVFLTRSRSPFS